MITKVVADLALTCWRVGQWFVTWSAGKKLNLPVFNERGEEFTREPNCISHSQHPQDGELIQHLANEAKSHVEVRREKSCRLHKNRLCYWKILMLSQKQTNKQKNMQQDQRRSDHVRIAGVHISRVTGWLLQLYVKIFWPTWS